MRKIIAITGTPGTGKTTLARELSKKLNAKLFDIKKIVDNNRLYTEIDRERRTKVVDIKRLKNWMKKITKDTDGDIIFDGLISQYLSPTHVVVLRTDPAELRKRLEMRRYPRKKVMENIEAEVMGVCLYDSLKHKNVLELDTTKKININNVLKWLEKGGKSVNRIDWLPRFYRVLKNENLS